MGLYDSPETRLQKIKDGLKADMIGELTKDNGLQAKMSDLTEAQLGYSDQQLIRVLTRSEYFQAELARALQTTLDRTNEDAWQTREQGPSSKEAGDYASLLSAAGAQPFNWVTSGGTNTISDDGNGEYTIMTGVGGATITNHVVTVPAGYRARIEHLVYRNRDQGANLTLTGLLYTPNDIPLYSFFTSRVAADGAFIYPETEVATKRTTLFDRILIPGDQIKVFSAENLAVGKFTWLICRVQYWTV